MSTASVRVTRDGAARRASASESARKAIASALGIRKTHACVTLSAAEATTTADPKRTVGRPQHAALIRDSSPGQKRAYFEIKVSTIKGIQINLCQIRLTLPNKTVSNKKF